MTGTLVYGHVEGVEDPAVLDDQGTILLALRAACAMGGATVLRTVAHRFEPNGVTAIAVLAESHAAVHTYPDLGAYMLDVFTCGADASPMTIAEQVIWSLGGGQPRLRKVKRGPDG